MGAALLFAVSCSKEVKEEAVATDVVNVEGENVADAQMDLNDDVINAQEAVNAAQRELDDATAKGDQVLTDAAQTKLNELQAKLDMIKKNAGEAIRATDGRSDGSDTRLDNIEDAAGAKLDNVKDAADNVKDKVE
ncbi:hypothetical protein [Kaistella polysaccharea]|uniref:hypothetical protein n=1 Tax=Kaistella polysaccharea TaxID=2878534 RepID=UPI001CF16727|nr:hypothetical protein [Kaistella polysaccharea]